MFGKYALLRPFARGGMGEICLAAHGELGGLEKLCLVKKVLEIDDQPSLTARLLDEAKVAVRLNHANLVQVFDAGKVDEELYIAMELIEGRDLRAVWNRTAERRSRIPLDVALYVIREMARGLEYAHNYGGLNLVHRDIAPPNILLSWHGEVKITDFGLARSTLKSEKTAPGIVYGRIAYLAPEQARGEQADKRTDVYAVGVILWELLTGRPLHETTEEAVKNLEMARHPRVAKPSNFARGITPSLDAVVLKALAVAREDRYQTADELRRALAEELARLAPTTDASRLSSWLSEQFEDVVKSEAIEHERLLREELPLLRLRSSAVHPAVKTSVARAQSLDLRIAGVDRDERPGIANVARPSDAAPTLAARAFAPTGQSPAVGVRAGVAPLHPTPAQPTVSSALRAPRGFDEDQETRVKESRTEAGRSRGTAAAARALDQGEDDTLASAKLVGAIIDGRYRIDRLLGTGGMGAVYEAEHTGIGKMVALKVLHPQFSRQADLVQRFRREALAASKVGHPNIIDVTDSGTTDQGDAYFVMERLDGTDLADVLRHETRLAIDRSIAIGAQICRALQAAHQAGIIHRDLKPENIFIVSRDGQPDFVKVLDFGIAKSEDVAQMSRRLTTPGIAMGTPEYMAPEQAAGKPVDGRVDIYSVGAILYEMLAGEPPHSGTSVMDILAKKATQPPEPLRDRNPSVPEPVERVIMSALERDPAARPQSMSALEYELNKCLKGRGSAVAAVLGIRTNDDGGWSEEGSRTGVESFFGGAPLSRHSGPIALGTPLHGSGKPAKLPSLGGIAELLEPGADGQASDANELAAKSLTRPSSLRSALGVLAGLAFLGGGGYLAYGFLNQTKPVVGIVEPKQPTPPPDPTPTNPVGKIEPTQAETQLTDAEVRGLLEWARRCADGNRIVAPPGDNLKELLDRIDKASPGNAAATELRTRVGGALGRRGTLALKKQKLEEAEDAFRALVALRPDDEWSKSRLGRTLALRADRSLARRKYAAAIADATSALELQPDDALARTVRAESLYLTGKHEQAIEEYRQVLEQRPTDKRAKKGLALATSAGPKKPKPGKRR